MLRLTLLIHLFVGTTFAGLAIIPTLLSFNSVENAWMLPAAAVAGLIVSIPVSWWIARAILRMGAAPASGASRGN